MEKKEIIQIILMFLIFLILGIFFTIMLVSMRTFIEYSTYKNLESESYDVTFEYRGGGYYWTCEIKVINQDNTMSYVHCGTIGNEYSLDNFAIKKDGSNTKSEEVKEE